MNVALTFCGDGLFARPCSQFSDSWSHDVHTQIYLSTSQRLDAARHKSQRSTGPRSEAGKERIKMNALKHGCDAAPKNEAAVMRALGEDPERYAALQRELATAYGPGDASATTKWPTWASSTGVATGSSAWRPA